MRMVKENPGFLEMNVNAGHCRSEGLPASIGASQGDCHLLSSKSNDGDRDKRRGLYCCNMQTIKISLAKSTS